MGTSKDHTMNDVEGESSQQHQLGLNGKPIKLTASCSRCREKKLKCNRALPCDQCTLRGFTDCRKDVRQPRVLGKRRRSHSSSGDEGKDPILALRRRLTELERKVDTSPQPLQLHVAFAKPEDGRSPAPVGRGASPPLLTSAESAARYMEDVIVKGYDNQSAPGAKDYKAKLFEKPNAYWHTSYSHPDHLAREEERSRLEEDVRKAITELDVKSRKHLLTVVVYRRGDHQSGRSLLLPVQYQTMERFCETGAYDDENGVKDINELALMCLILAKALQIFPGDHSLVPQSKVIIAWWRTGEKMRHLHSLGKRLLALDETRRPTSLAGMQALFHLINIGFEDAEELVVFESALQRAAHITGLHRLGSLPGLGQTDGRTKSEAQKLEVASRLWWALVARDWFSSQATRAYVIHPSHFTTRVPLHLNDMDLENLPFPAQRGLEEWTDTTLSLQSFKMADIVRASVDRLNSQSNVEGTEFPVMSKSTRISTAKAWEKFLVELPSFYQLEAVYSQAATMDDAVEAKAYREAAISIQRYCMHQMVFDQLLKLHRHELGSERVDPSTLMYAQMVLDFQGKVSGVCRVVDSWWMNIQHVVSACTVIILDLWADAHGQRGDGISRTMLRAKVRQAVSKFNTGDERVKRAVRLVEALMDAEEERSKSPHSAATGVSSYDELFAVVRSTMLAQNGGLPRARHDSSATPASSTFDGSNGLTYGSSSASSGASPATFQTGAYQDSLPMAPQIQSFPSLAWPDSAMFSANADFFRLDPNDDMLWNPDMPPALESEAPKQYNFGAYMANPFDLSNTMASMASSSSAGMMEPPPPPPPAPAPSAAANNDPSQEALWAWLFNSGGVNNSA